MREAHEFGFWVAVVLAVAWVGFMVWGFATAMYDIGRNAGIVVGREQGRAAAAHEAAQQKPAATLHLAEAGDVAVPPGWAVEAAACQWVYDEKPSPPELVGRRFDLHLTKFVPTDTPKEPT